MTLEPVRRFPAKGAAAVLALYWIVLCVGTHLPSDHVIMQSITLWDKFMHITAFAGLAVLLAATSVVWRNRNARIGSPASAGQYFKALCRAPLPRLNYLLIWVIAVAYGALDEPTQPTFGRDCDIVDLLADTLGATSGLFAFWSVTQIGSRWADGTEPRSS